MISLEMTVVNSWTDFYVLLATYKQSTWEFKHHIKWSWDKIFTPLNGQFSEFGTGQ